LIPISIQVNGRAVSREAEPRMHLGDFLRDELHLTGTHLSCEHGVCGACTVLVDGQPARSCITFAVACEGREITTVEGYDDDAVMQLLRPAFTRHHALQCGFCTPGMLATARDIVLRLPEADEGRVRLELAGNLCRCTGYQGIVEAILDVLQQVRSQPDARVQKLREAGGVVHTAPLRSQITSDMAVKLAPPASAGSAINVDAPLGGKTKGTRIDASFEVPYPMAMVWQFMGDLSAVASCLPGARVESQEGDRVKGSIAIKFGPMSAAFVGAARLERDDEGKRAVLRGAGQDSLSKSRAQGDIAYRLQALSAERTRVEVDMLYALQGPLAQFSRSGLVKDFVRRMVTDFGMQVTRRLSGASVLSTETGQSVSLARMMWDVLWARVRLLWGHR
jgi:carbon-monoxide dehydrogenase small subunit